MTGLFETLMADIERARTKRRLKAAFKRKPRKDPGVTATECEEAELLLDYESMYAAHGVADMKGGQDVENH